MSPVHRFGRALLMCMCLVAPAAAQTPAPPSPAEVAKPAPDAAAGVERWKGSIEVAAGMTLDFTAVFRTAADGTVSGVMSIPAQGLKDGALKDITVSGKELKFTLGIPGAPPAAIPVFAATKSDDGKSAAGSLSQSGMTIPLKMQRLAEGESDDITPKRPQEPKPPFPYRAEDVSFANPKADAVTLAGTLTVPEGKGPFPAVIMVSGSGPQNRDEELLGHKPFAVIADHLTRHGIAVLRYDDRGVGASKGDFATATTLDFAGDAVAAGEFLATRPEIDPKKIGVVGHSEGGLIAPIAAVQSGRIAFIVMLAGPGVPGDEILLKQSDVISRAGGVDEETLRITREGMTKLYALLKSGADTETLRAEMRKLADAQIEAALKNATPQKKAELEQAKASIDGQIDQQLAQLQSPWLRTFLSYDPRENLRKVKVPVLALNGQKDMQVDPAQNLPEVEKALREGGNKDVTATELAGLNHLFQHAETGSPAEYQKIEETFAPEALDAMVVWIRARTGLDAAAP